ncbi:MAG: capsular polysaccharide transport system permease protein [Alphaproteobacteria bacterium]|jgi:capsular polysaccharide transport system permease protein
MSYSQELQAIKAKRQRSLSWGLGLVVGLPTLIAIIYFSLIASPQYVSTTKFNVVVESAQTPNFLAGTLGLALGGGSSGSNVSEAYIVKEFLQSQDMIQILQEKINILTIFNHKNADFWAIPPSNPTIEAFLSYYNKMVDVSMDENNGLVTLNVAAFSPDDAIKIAKSIMVEAESFVNKRSDRVQKDSLKFAENFLSSAEKGVLKANVSLSEFRNKNQNFDPTMTAQGVLQITSQLEGELVKTKTEIATLKNYLKTDNPRIQNLFARKKSLETQIKSQGHRLAARKGATLADIAQKYESHKLKTEFSIKRYATALTGLEEARATAAQQMKYLLRVIGPTKPEDSIKPKVLKEILGTFFIALVVFTISSLILSALKDHIRS